MEEHECFLSNAQPLPFQAPKKLRSSYPLKAILKFNRNERRYYIYYYTGGRCHRMSPDGFSKPMSNDLKILAHFWSKKAPIYLVEEDEELYFSGKKFEVEMETFHMNLWRFEDVRT